MAKITRPKGRLSTLNKLITAKCARVEVTEAEPVVPFHPVWAGDEDPRCPTADKTDRAAKSSTSASTPLAAARVKFPGTVDNADEDEDEDEWEDEDEGVPPPNPYAVCGKSYLLTVY